MQRRGAGELLTGVPGEAVTLESSGLSTVMELSCRLKDITSLSRRGR
jgi:hypothetical protein